MKLLNPEEIKGGKADAFAVGFHEAPEQRTCWVQIGLQEPHDACASWLVLHGHLGGRQFPMEARQKSRSEWV